MASPHAWLYGNEALSDVTLAFVPKRAAPVETSANGSRGKKRKAHEEGPAEPLGQTSGEAQAGVPQPVAPQAALLHAQPQAEEPRANILRAEPRAEERQTAAPYPEPRAHVHECQAVALHVEHEGQPDLQQAVKSHAEPPSDERQAGVQHAGPTTDVAQAQQVERPDVQQAAAPLAEPPADGRQAGMPHAAPPLADVLCARTLTDVPCGPQADVQQTEEPTATHAMPCHRVILASASEFFRALFLRWTKDEKTVKLEYGGPLDLDAAGACIKAMYLQNLDREDLPQEPQRASLLLIKAVRWADMLQAPTCTELCISRLADSFRPGSPRDVNRMLECLPESVRSLPSFAKVQKVCQDWLQHSFSDVYEVITKIDVLKAFRQLCPHAVLLWMECNLMGTENDILALVTKWHEGPKGKSAQEGDLVALSRLLRLSRLAQSIQECLLPELPWFREGRLLRFFWTGFRRYGTDAPKEFPNLDIPDAWVAPGRQSTAPEQRLEREWFVWRVPVNAVAKMLEEEAEEPRYYSNVIYSNGASFFAYLNLDKSCMELDIYVGRKGRVPFDVYLSVLQQCPDYQYESDDSDYSADSDDHDVYGDGDRAVLRGQKVILNDRWGQGDVVAGPCTSQEFMPLLQQQLVDGHLVFKIKVYPV